MAKPANTRPEWMDDPAITQVEAPETIAAIEAAMKARGIDPPTNGWRANGTAPPQAQNQSLDPQLNGAAKAGFFARDDAPASVAEGGEGGSPVTPAPLPNDQAPAPVEPVAQSTGQPTTDAGDGGDGGDGTDEQTPAPGTLQVHLPTGQTWDMDEQQALYLLHVNQWANGQPDIVKQQWKGIEEGTHTAIPVPDYQAYQAWVTAGRPSQQQQQPVEPDLTLVDPDVAAYIATLKARVPAQQAVTQDQPPVQTPVVVNQPSPAYVAQQAANQQTAYNNAKSTMQTRYGLDEAQFTYLEKVTTGMNIVPGIAQSKRTYSPSGTLIADAPLQAVFEEAMEIAMSSDTSLKAIRDDLIIQQHLAANGSTLSKVAQKKANAGSLATAPSAAVPSMALDPRTMTPDQRHAAMVAELGDAMKDMAS